MLTKLSGGRLIASFTLAAMLALCPATAQEQPLFYRGKQITIVVGTSAGGGYDTYARLIARHIMYLAPPELIAKTKQAIVRKN
jgi:tripartite-type tricarboxylate transporter receptor subunit TctC